MRSKTPHTVKRSEGDGFEDEYVESAWQYVSAFGHVLS